MNDPLSYRSQRHGFPAGLMRAQRAVNRGLEALGRRPRPIVSSEWSLDSTRQENDRHREIMQRTRLEVLEAGRELIARGRELAAQAEAAKLAGVEALRYAHSPSTGVPWSELGDLLGMQSGQGAHKRYAAAVRAPEPELTIDDMLAADTLPQSIP